MSSSSNDAEPADSQRWQVPSRSVDEATGSGAPKKMRSEILAKASGAIFVLCALSATWILSALFSTRWAHLGVAGFNAIVTLQFLLWAIIRQGMSIIYLVAFDVYYTTPSRTGKRRSLNLYTLDAWMSLIITPINILRGRLLNVLLVLLPVVLSVFATYSTSSLLGRETTFMLIDNGVRDQVHVGPAGGGRTHAYVMTGMNFIYNASELALDRPENRFVYVMNERSILVPSIPNIGTYAWHNGRNDPVHRAVRIRKVPAVLADIKVQVDSDKDVNPADSDVTTVPGLGDVYYNATDTQNGTALVRVSIILENSGVYRQIYLDLAYKTVRADLVFATFDNGSHINRVEEVHPVSETIGSRLRGDKNLTMETVLDNFILSVHGESLSLVKQERDLRVTSLGLLLAGAFGIRSAIHQEWLDEEGMVDADVLLERTIVLVPARYWAVAGISSILLGLGCFMMIFRRTTINGNLVQLVSLLERFIQKCAGACTPKWQNAYVRNRTFAEKFMNSRIVLGYSIGENGEREVITTFTADGKRNLSHHIAFDSEENITMDKLDVLYKLLAGTCRKRITHHKNS